MAGVPMSELVIQTTAPRLKLPTIALLPPIVRAAHAHREALRCDVGHWTAYEVRVLHARGDLRPNLPSMRSVGYRRRGASSTVNVRCKSFVRRASPLRGSWPRADYLVAFYANVTGDRADIGGRTGNSRIVVAFGFFATPRRSRMRHLCLTV